MITYEDIRQDTVSVHDLEFVVFDFETTGVHSMVDEIVELGAVRMDINGNILQSFSSLINPGIPIPEHVVQIHGICDDDVKKQPGPMEVVSEFINFAQNSLLVAHNARFDGGFLEKYLQSMYSTMPVKSDFVSQQKVQCDPISMAPFAGVAVLDTVSLARTVYPGLPSYSLYNLKKHWNIHVARNHRGLDDARAAARILWHCSRKSMGFAINPSNRILKKTWKQARESYVLGRQKWPKQKQAQKIFRRYQYLQYALSDAQKKQCSIPIKYLDTRGQHTTRKIVPLKLFFHYTNPYIEAFCYLRNAKRVFRLDRMNIIDNNSKMA